MPSPGGWWGQRRSRTRTRPALLRAGAPLRSASRRGAAWPERGRRSRAPRTPRRPRDRVPAFVCARRGRAGQAGACARAAGPSGVIAGVWEKKPPEPAGAADCSPERGSFPRRGDKLSFASLGRSQSFWRALCWEFRVYCGHPGEGSSLHLDRDATETSHRFLSLFPSGAFQCAVGLAFVNLMRFRLSAVLVLSRCQGWGELFIKDSFWTAFCFECSTISIVLVRD